mmetsp:Transcript_37871/g.42403  ORF Transcript_37871/g.42403 Transcript_37871/m.42403 type:complete len:997 (+) Transcript_37871:31-3021(+)
MEDNNSHKPMTKNPRPSSHLIPSQALQSSAPSSQKSGNGNVDNNNNKRNNRKRRNNKAKNGENNRNQTNSPPTPTDQQNVDDTTVHNSGELINNIGGKDQQQRRRKQKQKQRGNKKAENDVDNKNDDSNEGNSSSQKLNNPKRKQKKNKKKYPWRRYIPKGSVDPITLENLQTLEYPPFALVADEPYVTIPQWPIILGSFTPGGKNKDSDKNTNIKKDVNVENLNRQRLAEQWGMDLLPSKKGTGIGEYATTTAAPGNTKTSSSDSPHIPLSERPLNLFDGRALAFYMVSQLQFIDPLTRRDLTRPELVNLDCYLVRHGCGGSVVGGFNSNEINQQRKDNKKDKKILVTDAYDAKGITISSAGAAATTAQGRTDIMQQMAQQLLNSLFVGQSVSTLTPTNNSNRIESGASTRRRRRNVDGRQRQQEQQEFLERQQAESFTLQEQYDVMQRQERTSAALQEQQYEPDFGDAGNYYHDRDIGGGGFTIIDDDENPELRGRNGFPSLSTTIAATENSRYGDIANSSPFYSASHIAGRHGGNGPQTMGAAFPSLPSASSTNNTSSSSYLANDAEKINNNNSNVTEKSSSKTKKKSKTLAKISGIVKKTTLEEKQKQWEAREAARRRALMSNLTFGSNPAPSLLTSLTNSVDFSGSVLSATEEQLQRNRAFAEALGVKPAAQRHYASGWSRPTTEEDEDEGANIELLHELDVALYPDVLIAQARDLMQLLLKLEKKWKRFLNDDKAASLPLNHMDKPSRAFVHQYAEFWNLKTESFDLEPKRYVHCVKLPYTRMPRPLLSEVATRCRALVSLPDATRTLYDSLPNSTRTLSGHTSQQTAGQTSKSRELPPPPNRVPLPLKTRSVSPAFPERPFRAVTGMSSRKGIPIPVGTAQNSRSETLMDKERPKLEILPRSVPLELPPFEQQQQSTATYDAEEDLKKRQARLLERRQRDKIIEEKKKKVLLEAFASDDDEDKINANTVDSDSEWGEEQEPFYVESDEE